MNPQIESEKVPHRIVSDPDVLIESSSMVDNSTEKVSQTINLEEGSTKFNPNSYVSLEEQEEIKNIIKMLEINSPVVCSIFIR